MIVTRDMGLHDELEWMTKAGLSPIQAQTATINAAKVLLRENTQGTVTVGKRETW